jgi:hypothetical protein
MFARSIARIGSSSLRPTLSAVPLLRAAPISRAYHEKVSSRRRLVLDLN